MEAQRKKRNRDATQDTPLIRALGLAHYWQRLLDERRFTSVAEIAKDEGIDASRVYRLLRLAWLAPEIIERLLNRPPAVLEQMMRRTWPSEWRAQVETMNSTR